MDSSSNPEVPMSVGYDKGAGNRYVLDVVKHQLGTLA